MYHTLHGADANTELTGDFLDALALPTFGADFILLAPYPAESIASYPVSRRVNKPRNDDPDCLTPIEG